MDTIGTGSIEELVMKLSPKGYITFTNQELIDFINEVKKELDNLKAEIQRRFPSPADFDMSDLDEGLDDEYDC